MRRLNGRDVPDVYKNFFTEEMKNQPYNTLREFEFADALNGYLRKFDLQVERVISPKKQYSEYDVQVVEYNYEVLDKGRIVCKIDLENKPQDPFTTFPIPPARWHSWSFLWRKVSDNRFGDTDVYVLYNGDNYENIFWASFVKIRANCDVVGKTRENKYYRTSIKKQFVSNRLMNLANYVMTIREMGKFSSQTASQKTIGDCI